MNPTLAPVRNYLIDLQTRITERVEALDGQARFLSELDHRKLGNVSIVGERRAIILVNDEVRGVPSRVELRFILFANYVVSLNQISSVQ